MKLKVVPILVSFIAIPALSACGALEGETQPGATEQAIYFQPIGADQKVVMYLEGINNNDFVRAVCPKGIAKPSKETCTQHRIVANTEQVFEKAVQIAESEQRVVGTKTVRNKEKQFLTEEDKEALRTYNNVYRDIGKLHASKTYWENVWYSYPPMVREGRVNAISEVTTEKLKIVRYTHKGKISYKVSNTRFSGPTLDAINAYVSIQKLKRRIQRLRAALNKLRPDYLAADDKRKKLERQAASGIPDRLSEKLYLDEVARRAFFGRSGVFGGRAYDRTYLRTKLGSQMAYPFDDVWESGNEKRGMRRFDFLLANLLSDSVLELTGGPKLPESLKKQIDSESTD